MGIVNNIFKNVKWLAFFKLLSQGVSWLATIMIARILVPEDYGLLEMATFITSYAAMFCELGLGSAIIQRPYFTEKELSSTFWCGTIFSIFLAVLCLFLAYPTAAIFHNQKLIPITQSVAILFIISGVQVVPSSLMQKKMQFKEIGFIELMTILVSSVSMVILAYLKFGVWTLVLGQIVRNTTRLFIMFYFCRWLPKFYFNFKEAKTFLSFGISVAISQSLFYLYSKSDKFFAAKVWSTAALGRYSFALDLARLPTEKIVVLVNQVSFPAFARIQNNAEEFRYLYLKILKITALIVVPMFIGISLVAHEVIEVILNDKWYSMIPLFQWLCLAQIPTALNAVNAFVHTAQGRPKWSLVYNIMLAVCMPIAFYFCATPNVNTILIPWFTVYFLITGVWIFVTVRKLNIGLREYIKNLFPSFLATLLMSCAVLLCKKSLLSGMQIIQLNLLIQGIVGAGVYFLFVLFFDKDLMSYVKKMITGVA